MFKKSILGFGIAVLFFFGTLARAESPAEILEKGIYAEETEGNLTKAIELYQKVTAEAKTAKESAAEAQYRLGQCYLKQKKSDKAQAAFEKLIKTYPDQTDWVAKAAQHVPLILKYDDDSMESKRSITGGGHAILFKRPPQGDWYLDQVQLFGARYGLDKAPNEDFFIYITDAEMTNVCKIAKPYSTFAKGKEKWYSIKIQPVKVPEEFYVCFVFNPMQTKGVYVGINEGVSESHSKEAVPGDHSTDMEKGDWMIRAHLSPTATGKVQVLLGKEDQEKAKEIAAAESDAKLLKGAPSTVLKHDNGTMDQHQSYGGPSAQTIEFEAPADKPFVYGVTFYGSQYGGKHDAEAVNGDIFILDKNKNVLSRTSFPYSRLTYEKAWIDIPVLPTKVSGKFYVAIYAHSEQFKGLYVGYNENIEQSHSSVSEVAPTQFKDAPNDKKLEWMIRAKMTDKPVYFEAEEK